MAHYQTTPIAFAFAFVFVFGLNLYRFRKRTPIWSPAYGGNRKFGRQAAAFDFVFKNLSKIKKKLPSDNIVLFGQQKDKGLPDIDMETQVWRSAQTALGERGLSELVLQILRLYRRAPGHDVNVRLHESCVGRAGLTALRSALHNTDSNLGAEDGQYVTVRSRLRYHPRYELQSFLVRSDHATEAVLEHHLSQDLNL